MAKSMAYIQDTQTLIGERKRELVDRETGEVILVDQITKRVYGTRQFWKVYLMDFLSILGIIDNKQLDVFIHIVSHTNPSTNMFVGTYKEIAEACNVSEPTIAKIMAKLQINKFIAKRLRGVWYVNPNVLMKGNDTKRQILLSYYESAEPVNSIEVNRAMRQPIKTDANGVKYQETPPLLEEVQENAKKIVKE